MSYHPQLFSVYNQQTLLGVAGGLNFTATKWGMLFRCDATAGNITVTLPTAIGSPGAQVDIERTDASANTVTILPNGTQTIGGSAAASVLITGQNTKASFISNGANVDFEQGGSGGSAFVAPGAWVASTLYTAGQQAVSPTGALIERKTAGTSAASFTTAEGAAWQFLSTLTVSTWAANTFYFQGQQLFNTTLTLLLRTSSGTSLGSFNTAEAANYISLEPGPIDLFWLAGQPYFGGHEFVDVNGQFFRYKPATTVYASGGSIAADGGAGFLEFLGMVATHPFNGGQYYFAGAHCTANGIEYERIAAGTSLATFALDIAAWYPVASLTGKVLLTSVMTVAALQPTVAGIYSFSVAPTNGLPAGIALGDIATYNGTTWAVTYSAAIAPEMVAVGATLATSAPYNQVNGIYAVAPLAAVNYFSKLLNNVTPAATTGPNPIAAWSATYTAHGGTVVVTADVTALGTSGQTPQMALLRDGVAVDKRLLGYNVSGHMPFSTLRAILPGETGLHTYSISMLTTGIQVDANDRGSMVVEEYGAATAQTGQTVAYATVTAVGAGPNTQWTTVAISSSATMTALLPVGQRATLTGATLVNNVATAGLVFNAATCTYTCSAPGSYGVSVNAGIAASPAASLFLQCVQNGATVFGIGDAAASVAGSDEADISIDTVVTLAAGDTVDFRWGAGGATTVEPVSMSIVIAQLGSSAAAVLNPMTGATSGLAGAPGLTPANGIGTQDNPLYGDATFGVSGRLTAGTLANQAANFTISIDPFEAFVLNQTTAGITATVPNPAVTTKAYRKRITNAGTVSIKITNSTATQTVLLAAGAYLEAAWDVGGSAFNIGMSSANTLVPVVQRFVAGGTYTPTFGMKYAIVEMVGGGAGGGGCAAGTNAVITIGGAGGAGGYARAQLTAAQIGASQVVTIGAAGAGGVTGPNAGGAGGTTSLGALMSAAGGNGGAGGALAGSFPVYAQQGGVGGAATVTTGTVLATASGQPGTGGSGAISGAGVMIQVGNGASGPFGSGGRGNGSFANTGGPLNITSLAATGNGCGGSGCGSSGSGSSAQAGGNGTFGLVSITEYFA